MNTILVVGNVVDGLYHIGPFVDSEDAALYAELHCKGEDWICTQLQKPRETYTHLVD